MERAIIILSERGFLNGWYNQIPIASGLLDEVSDKRAAVYWVHMKDDCLELVELKWASDTPLYAIFEILRYGLTYLFCYMNKVEFDFQDLPAMNVSRIKLTTLAPKKYYSYCDLKLLFSAINLAINSLYMEKSDGLLSSRFTCSAFPIDFALPFKTGAEVMALRDLPADNPTVGILINAMNNQISAWEN
ncbi:MAG: hypothetical protein GXP02_08505 [Alphaproteobacteria bacterium]|nr:hypothetical protein [Alphaproteobacteria bacterium]